ncbi:hypothetical protein ACO2Q3_08950 [Caulobacter sp. KR2-114]|uniref:hypothetical protein n=1 Tax=Caulobacter sp. KR2-114 TaxID=3400912 RepID=UPI003C0202DF
MAEITAAGRGATIGRWRNGGLLAAAAALALGGCNFLHRPTVEEQADKIATIKVLHQYYPEQYQQVIAMLKATPAPSGATAQASVEDRVRPVITSLMARQAPKMNDENTLALFQLTVDEAQTMRQKSPEQCGKNLTGGGQFGVTAESVMTKDEIERDAALSAKILEQTATAPAPPPPPMDQAASTALVRQSISRLPQATQDNLIPMLRAGGHPSGALQEAAMCDYTISLIQLMLAQPKDKAAPMLRNMAAMGG